MDKKPLKDFELIRVTDNQITLDDGIYFQIECIKTHKDMHYQRVINKGELGGYVHVESIEYLQDKWIEKNSAVGKPVMWEGRPTRVMKKSYSSSAYMEFYYVFENHYKSTRIKAQTGEPSKKNGVLTHATRILEMIVEVVNFERKLDNIGYNNETQLILLWTMIGAIQESILKLHVVIFSNEYKSLRKKSKDDVWEEQTDTIIRTLLKLKHIDHDNMLVLEKINNNRNMIHLLNFGSVFDYQEYLNYVKKSCDIYESLFKLAETKFQNL